MPGKRHVYDTCGIYGPKTRNLITHTKMVVIAVDSILSWLVGSIMAMGSMTY